MADKVYDDPESPAWDALISHWRLDDELARRQRELDEQERNFALLRQSREGGCSKLPGDGEQAEATPATRPG